MALSAALEQWRRRGTLLRLRDLDVFCVTEGTGPTILVLHGFPTSSYDFRSVLRALAREHRVVLLDLPGFGLSSKPTVYSYSLLEQADIVLAACAALGVDRAHVFAHDMGTSVACELLARREDSALPVEIRSVVLMNGSIHLEMARLTASQRALRRPLLGRVFAHLASRATFKLQFRRLFARPDALSEPEIDRLWELLTYEDGHLRLPIAIRYLDERVQRAARWIGPLTRLDLPALVLWGRKDPVARIAIAERLASEIPGARLSVLDDLGHYPQLEDPTRVAEQVLGFFRDVERRAQPRSDTEHRHDQ